MLILLPVRKKAVSDQAYTENNMKPKRHNEPRRSEAPRKPQTTAVFIVKHSDQLLPFLLAKYDGKLSRNSVKKLLSDRKILVNGSLTTQFNFPLAKDDEVSVAKQPVRTKTTVRGKQLPQVPSIKPYIIYEDEEFLAIDKPAGLLSVESDKEQTCAYQMAVEYLKKTSPNTRPYILHRIDKETSGVLVFAKDIRLHSMLKMHWNEDVTMREYYAVVAGIPEEPSGRLVNYLRENQNHIVYVTRDPHGKKAITNYETVASGKDCSLLRVVIETGRKNQIRAQMNEIGHPILGDDKYARIPSPIDRLCLHASVLEFTHPVTEKPMRFSAPVPSAFKTLVKKRP